MMMRAKLNITEGIFPMPVLMVATYNEDGSVNVMNAAWGTMQERGRVALNLTETHKTVKNIKARGAFTVSVADAAHVKEADYFGVESGNRAPDNRQQGRDGGRPCHQRVSPVPGVRVCGVSGQPVWLRRDREGGQRHRR